MRCATTHHRNLRCWADLSEFDYAGVIDRILEKNRWGNEGALAKALGISPNTWTSYKQGKSSFGLHDIAKICDVLGVTPSWLLFGDETFGRLSLLDQVEAIVKEVHVAVHIHLSEEAVQKTTATYFRKLHDDLLDKDDGEEVRMRLVLLRKVIERDAAQAVAHPGTGKRSAS